MLLGVRSRQLLDRHVRDLDDGGTVLWIRRKAKTRRGKRRVRVPEPLFTLLQAQVKGREPSDLIFGELEGQGRPRSSSWLADEVKKLCSAAGITVVCPQGLRGTHSSLAEGAGITPLAVAASLGHTSPKVTGEHYTLPEVRQDAQQERVLKLVQAGSR
jgi:integrase